MYTTDGTSVVPYNTEWRETASGFVLVTKVNLIQQTTNRTESLLNRLVKAALSALM